MLVKKYRCKEIGEQARSDNNVSSIDYPEVISSLPHFVKVYLITIFLTLENRRFKKR
jgi:hypothetical protein